jgi:hypothetical protein
MTHRIVSCREAAIGFFGVSSRGDESRFEAILDPSQRSETRVFYSPGGLGPSMAHSCPDTFPAGSGVCGPAEF